MLKRALFIIGWLVLCSASVEGSVIVSGLDDVLRQANNTSLINVSLKVLEKDRGYAGMPALYRGLIHKSEVKKFYLLSAMTNLLDKRVENFLQNENFPPAEIYLRNWITEWSIEDFKLSTFQKISSFHPENKFIVILDNSLASQNFALSLKNKYQEKIESIYLRKTTNQEVKSQDFKYFITTADIAVSEFNADRLEKKSVEEIYAEILRSKDEQVIPTYAYCPLKYKTCSQLKLKIQSCEQVERKVQTICNKRN